MRQGQNQKWNRGRKPRGQNMANRALESNGPNVKVRGTPSHIYKRYQMLARDAQMQGDRVRVENYLQHAEHYYRLAMQAQNASQQNSERPPHNEAADMNNPSALPGAHDASPENKLNQTEDIVPPSSSNFD